MRARTTDPRPRRSRILRAVPDVPPDYPVAEDDLIVDVVPVPADGPLLFVLHLPHPAADPDGQAAAESLRALQVAADDIAPDRHQVVVLAGGLTLDVLDDAALAEVGLQRIPGPLAGGDRS